MIRFAAAIAMLGALCAGCDCGGEPPSITRPPAHRVPEVVLGFEGRTTDGEVALTNLSAQIDGLGPAVLAHPSDAAPAIALLLLRAEIRADVDDLDRALALANAMPDPIVAATSRARVLSALHEWDAALAALDTVLDAESQRDAIALARGHDVERIVADRTLQAAATGSLHDESELAIALAEAGRYEEADAAYVRALRAHHDISPFPIAAIQAQRAAMWADRAGEPERALPLYREAVRRVPDFVAANVHLAALEAQLGDETAAVGRLTRVSALSPDAEASAVLATLLASTRPEEAARARTLARARYDALLARHALAYADHAAEFDLAAGNDADEALALARTNVANRPTERAYDLAIRAAMAAHDRTARCAFVDAIVAPVHTRTLEATLELARPDCL